MNSGIVFSHHLNEIIWHIKSAGGGTTITISSSKVSRYRIISPYIIVHEVVGTAPTLDVALEANIRLFRPPVTITQHWVTIFTFHQITKVGVYKQAPFEICEMEIRYKLVVGGTLPRFDVSLGHILGT